MKVSVAQFGEWWALVSAEGAVRTPMGTPVVSRHRALLDEVAADVMRWGTDPTAKTTTFSLQASYLDFGLRVKREVLEENTAAIWPDDLYVQRPAGPELAQALRALWPEVAFDRAAFREALRALPLRKLMAAMTAGQVLRSAVLGREVVTTAAGLVPLTRGACGRSFDALQARTPPGAVTPSRRHVPTQMDDAYCAGVCCAPGVGPDADFAARCALFPLLDGMRRWASWPEEVEKG
ncbi:MAG TPA: hypothetical protein VLT61_05255 [Anaeromyxobacteraceae bacterium]|nr:hypothetical protein [Anaeromyxobacteraceae bacterium]